MAERGRTDRPMPRSPLMASALNRLPPAPRLAEDDFLFGGDDDGDINPFDMRRTVSIDFTPGAPGGALDGGRRTPRRPGGRGDEAQITYSLDTGTPEPMRVPDPFGPRPDLVGTAFTFPSRSGIAAPPASRTKRPTAPTTPSGHRRAATRVPVKAQRGATPRQRTPTGH
jgi:hypothetical protein